MVQSSTPFPETRRRFLLAGFLWFRPGEIAIAESRLKIVRRKKAGVHYLHIHGNETTARDVLQTHLRTHGGTGFLIANSQRNVPIGGGWIDPNRLFSRAGAERSLRGLNADWKEDRIQANLKVLDKQRERLIKALLPPKNGLLFALHNNSQGYSIRDEVPVSDAVSLSKPDQPNDFFLTTQPTDFERLKKSAYNVVLQSSPGTDDGSLSRLASRLGFRYLNLECKLGNAALQREMLEWAAYNLL